MCGGEVTTVCSNCGEGFTVNWHDQATHDYAMAQSHCVSCQIVLNPDWYVARLLARWGKRNPELWDQMHISSGAMQVLKRLAGEGNEKE